jgi:hypothetical protein
MRKLHKGLIIGGVTLAALVPAGLVAADQIDMGNGHGRRQPAPLRSDGRQRPAG